jgi:hypothetical protein
MFNQTQPISKWAAVSAIHQIGSACGIPWDNIVPQPLTMSVSVKIIHCLGRSRIVYEAVSTWLAEELKKHNVKTTDEFYAVVSEVGAIREKLE